MKFRRKKTHEFEIFSNSFSDIMFFLMLFFLITSTMITPGVIKLILPHASNVEQNDKPKLEVAISITKELKYYINNDEVQLSEIENRLVTMKEQTKELIVLVRAEESISVQNLLDVLQIGNKLGLKTILATNKTNEQIQ